MPITECNIPPMEPGETCNARGWTGGEWAYCQVATAGVRCPAHNGEEGAKAHKEKAEERRKSPLERLNEEFTKAVQEQYEILRQDPLNVKELDDEIIKLAALIDVLERDHAGYMTEAIRRAKETKAKLIETKAKVDLLLKDTLTTDLIWTEILKIVDGVLVSEEDKKQIMGRVRSWLNELVEQVAQRAG